MKFYLPTGTVFVFPPNWADPKPFGNEAHITWRSYSSIINCSHNLTRYIVFYCTSANISHSHNLMGTGTCSLCSHADWLHTQLKWGGGGLQQVTKATKFSDNWQLVLFSVFCFYPLLDVCAGVATHVSQRLVGKEHVTGYVTSAVTSIVCYMEYKKTIRHST